MRLRNRQFNDEVDSVNRGQGSRRIEPSFGDVDIADDELVSIVAEVPRRRPSARAEHRLRPESIDKAEGDKAGVDEAAADVLLDAPSPRWRQRREAVEPVAQPERREGLPKRERGYSKVSPRGEKRAAPKPARPRPARNWSINPKWLLLGLLLIALVAAYFGHQPLGELLQRPFKSVVVEGEFHLISKKRATQLISDEIDSNFLRLDLLRLKHALMADPWVESVSLTRRWPDTLVVKISEQKPIARWGTGFLNQRGQIVEVASTDKLVGLPWFEGSANDAVEILQQYQDFSQLLRPRGLDVIALKCDNKKSWRLTLKNNVEIALGRNQVMEKMRRFVTVYDTELQAIWDDVKAVDVRYTNGIAVRWVEGSESAKKYLQNRSTSTAGLTPTTGASAQ